jgi:NitT/TauT family transport system substrate-binding protein
LNWLGLLLKYGVILIVAMAMLVQACTQDDGKFSKPLVWGGPKNISMIPVIAERKGFFQEVGLRVKSNYVQTGKVAMDAIVSGDLDFGIIVDTNIAFIKFQDGVDIKVIASVAEKHDDAIVARQDQGITKPQDLEGRTVAILPGTTSHRFADLFIDFYRLDRKKIEFLNLSPPSIQAGVINGNIEAGSVWQPYRYNIQRELGDRAIQFHDKRIYTAYSLVAVKKGLTEQRQQDTTTFLRALIKAEEFIRDHKEEAIAILSEELNTEKDVLKAVWDEYQLIVDLDEGLVRTFRDEGAWIVNTQKGFDSKTVPSYQDVLDTGFLRQIDPKRVKVT